LLVGVVKRNVDFAVPGVASAHVVLGGIALVQRHGHVRVLPDIVVIVNRLGRRPFG
jgi:hypothetical protein